MTATPHNGKEQDFQLFLALLDGDRFEGRFRDGVHAADVSDLMRRMVKERLLKFDGKPLFPERIAYTGYFGEVEQRFRGSGTRIPAKWNARRSVATLLSQFPPIGVAADRRDPTRDLVFESTDESACGSCGRRVRRPKGVGNAPSLTVQFG